MFKLQPIDVLHDLNKSSIANSYAVDWEALDKAGYRFDAYYGEKDGVEYLVIINGRSLGVIIRKNGIVEAIRPANDVLNRQALETAIERNLDWHFYENNSTSYTVQKPRAFLGRLFGKKASNVAELKETLDEKLIIAKKSLETAEAKVASNPQDSASAAVVEGLKQVVNIMTDVIDSPEVINAEVIEVKPDTFAQRIAKINHSGMTRAERIEAMQALAALDEYATDPAADALRANLAPQPPVGTAALEEIAERKAMEAGELVIEKPAMEIAGK